MKKILDEKGQAEIIGVILTISIIVIAFSLIQSGMVPQWNQEIEFNHYQEATDDMQKLASVMERVAAQGQKETAEIQLGTTYPERGPLINPPPAQGTLQTYDTQITINNAIAKQSDAQCYWDGTEITYDSQGLMYTPNYNYQEGTPPIHLEHSNLIIGYEQNPEFIQQKLIGDNNININNIKGEYEATGHTLESLGIYPKSAPPNTVAMESTDQENIEITLQTKAPEAYEELKEKDTVESIETNETNDQEVTITLTEGTYYFKTTALSLDEDRSPEPEYIMTYDHDRNNTAPTTIETEVRDQYNNPLPGQKVNFSYELQEGKSNEVDVTIYNEETETDERGIAKTLVTVDYEENIDEVINIKSELSPYIGNCSWTHNNIIIGDPDIEEPEPPVDWELNIIDGDHTPDDITITMGHDRVDPIPSSTEVKITVLDTKDDKQDSIEIEVSDFDEIDNDWDNDTKIERVLSVEEFEVFEEDPPSNFPPEPHTEVKVEILGVMDVFDEF